MTDTLRVWSYSRCSTCRKALTWLDQQGVAYEVVDITEDPPSRDLLAEATSFFGKRAPLFNTSGLSYRALGSAVVKAMTDDQALDALAADGKLIKRPFVALPGGQFLVGFKQDQWEEALHR